MESEIPYQRLIELNLIVEGCLRTLAVRESPDTQLMLADCLTEINTLAAPLLQQAYKTMELEIQEEPVVESFAGSVTTDHAEAQREAAVEIEHSIGGGDTEPVEEMLSTSEKDEEMAPEDEPEEEIAPAKEPDEEMASTDELEDSETEEFVLDGDDLVEIEEEVEDNPQEVMDEEPETLPIEPKVHHIKDNNRPAGPVKDNDLRLDELLSRREARQLRKAFTLNDKFRFRRELFNGDDAMFARTLDMIQAMNSMDEATRYLCDDLGWDSENEHVADFMAIVANHFAEV